jgi:hypothetical protein
MIAVSKQDQGKHATHDISTTTPRRRLAQLAIVPVLGRRPRRPLVATVVQEVVQVQPLVRVGRVVGVRSGSGRTGQGRLSGSRARAGLVHVTYQNLSQVMICMGAGGWQDEVGKLVW